MSTRLAIDLNDDQERRLSAIAGVEQRTVAETAKAALEAFLEDDAAFRRAVEDGLAAGARGEVEDFDLVAGSLRRRMSERVRSAQ